MYCLASLFLNKRTLRSFGINTSVYKHVRKIEQISGTDSFSQKFYFVYCQRGHRRCDRLLSPVRRDTLGLRRYDYL